LHPPDKIRTARLFLRPASLADAQAIFDGYAHDPEVVRYLEWKPHPSVEATEEFLSHCEKVRGEGRAFPYVFALSEQGKAIGMIELRPKGTIASLGYVLSKDYWGQGFMVEAIQAINSWALNTGGFQKVEATCDVENLASARVMEKAGMRPYGILKNHSNHPNISAEPRDALGFEIP
jgi:ribosomal-protein-alanine N-acetyltransferase